MSAYSPTFVHDAALGLTVEGVRDSLLITISPSTIAIKEPMVAAGEIVFAGSPPDIVEHITEVIPVTASISIVSPP